MSVFLRQIIEYTEPIYRQKTTLSNHISKTEKLYDKGIKIVEYFFISNEDNEIQQKISDTIEEFESNWVLDGEPSITEVSNTNCFNIQMTFQGVETTASIANKIVTLD